MLPPPLPRLSWSPYSGDGQGTEVWGAGGSEQILSKMHCTPGGSQDSRGGGGGLGGNHRDFSAGFAFSVEGKGISNKEGGGGRKSRGEEGRGQPDWTQGSGEWHVGMQWCLPA